MPTPLTPDRLARRTDPASLPFETTAGLPELTDLVGQDRAVAAVSFGIGIRQPGFNVYAMGPEGIGKYRLVRQYLAGVAPTEPVPRDWCYVHDFADPRRPRAISLRPGAGRGFRDRLTRLNRDLRSAIPAAFESEEYRHRKEDIESRYKEQREAALAAFDRRANARGATLLRTPIGVGLALTKDGKILEREAIDALPEPEQRRLMTLVGELERELGELVTRVFPRWEAEARTAIRALGEEVTRQAVSHLIDDVQEAYADEPVIVHHLDDVETDVVANAEEFLAAQARDLPAVLAARLEDGSAFRRYQVNLIVDHATTVGAPVVFEDHPTQPNLLGRIEHTASFGALVTDHTLIRPGALHRANGGYLVLDARRVLAQPYAWDDLKRVLRTGVLRIESPAERFGLGTGVSLEPEPIPLEAKVVLVGDRLVYYLLAELDPDFLELFKVQADFEEDLERTPATELEYARLLGTVAARERLRPLDRAGTAALVDHAARLAGDAGRLSTHMRQVTDVLREADHLATREGRATIGAADVTAAVTARRHRAARIHERTLDAIDDGTIIVATSGEAIGVVNGLSVLPLGEAAFGRPTRITASVRLGDGEVVDIEREVHLGGPIHSKGVLILSGFLGARYGRGNPLSVRASLVFEQSYGGVEGDSATLAEACALVSAIGEVPIRQAMAVTGSLNQRGEVQAVGGVNEKIEGFFDVCAARGLDGTHGVLVPEANVHHLMLRDDVVAAVEAGRFAIIPVATIDDALESLTGLAAGDVDASGAYPAGSVNGRVAAGLATLADRAIAFLRRGEAGGMPAVGTGPGRNGRVRGGGRRKAPTGARTTG